MTKNQSDITIISIIIGVVIIGSIYQETLRNHLLSQDSIYVIGHVTERAKPAKGNAFVTFWYNNPFTALTKTYEITTPERLIRVKVGDRYFVALPDGHFDDGIILFDQPVPDSIRHNPTGGWKEIPTRN